MSSEFVHTAGLYADEDEFRSMMIGVARDGAAVGEPTVFALTDSSARLLHEAVLDIPGVIFVPNTYSRPPMVIRAMLALFRSWAAADGGGLRIVGEVHDLTPPAWEPWARYEAAVNHIFAGYRVSALCAYNVNTTPDAVLAEVERTHPRLATADNAPRPSDRYLPPETFLRSRPQPSPDPIERGTPVAELIDPVPATARRVVAEVAARTSLAPTASEDFICGVNEVVTNANLYGRPPCVLRIWAASDRLHAVVSDTGSGPTDPFAGLQPSARSGRSGGGMGLWIAHQLCDRVTHANHDGFTVRLTAEA